MDTNLVGASTLMMNTRDLTQSHILRENTGPLLPTPDMDIPRNAHPREIITDTNITMVMGEIMKLITLRKYTCPPPQEDMVAVTTMNLEITNMSTITDLIGSLYHWPMAPTTYPYPYIYTISILGVVREQGTQVSM